MNRVRSLVQKVKIILYCKRWKSSSAALQCELTPENVEYLKKFGILYDELCQNKDKLPEDFETIKHYVEILEEASINVTIQNLKKFRQIYKMEISDLIAKGVTTLDSSAIEGSMLKYLEQFPYNPYLPMHSVESIERVYTPIKQYFRRECYKCNKTDESDMWLSKLSNEKRQTIEILKIRILRQYYSWKFKTRLIEIDKLIYNYSKVTGIRSLRSLRETLSILENTLKFPHEKIVRNFFLMSIIPRRLEDVIKNVPKSFNIAEAALVAPKILARSSQQIQEIEQTLKDNNMLGGNLHMKPYIFTFTPSTIHKRIAQIKSGPLSVFVDHPRIYELIVYYNKAKRRYYEMEAKGYKCFGISILVCNEQVFQRFIENGADKTKGIRDHLTYLSSILDVPCGDLRQTYKRHPLNQYVPLTEIKDTLEYLLKIGFQTKIIEESITIVLYEKGKIEEALNEINKCPEMRKMGLVNGFTENNTKALFQHSNYKDKRLILCLYLMEKPFNFTGEGVVRSYKRKELD